MRPGPGRYVGLPAGDSSYARAKRAHVAEKDYARAEKLYLQAIERPATEEERGKRSSAVTDLAQMWHEMGKTRDAIRLVKEKRSLLGPSKADNILLGLFQTSGCDEEAVALLNKRLKKTPGTYKLPILRQLAYLHLRMGDVRTAERTLHSVLAGDPTDVVAARLLERCQNPAPMRGDEAWSDAPIEEGLREDWSVGISPLLRFYLERSRLEGIDPKAVAEQSVSREHVWETWSSSTWTGKG